MSMLPACLPYTVQSQWKSNATEQSSQEAKHSTVCVERRMQPVEWPSDSQETSSEVSDSQTFRAVSSKVKSSRDFSKTIIWSIGIGISIGISTCICICRPEI
jgi:hypothetical protein